MKYRQKIFFGEVEKSLKEILLKIATDNKFEITEIEIDKNHIHLLVECSPQHQIPSIIKTLKGVSARLLFLKHPYIKNIYGVDIYGISYCI